VSIERVLSGPGLVNIHEYLKASGRYREPGWLARRRESADPAQAIAEAALDRRTPIAAAALDRFVSILGAAAGNLALTALSTGGLYLGGGIPPKILPFIEKGSFLRAFLDKGRFRGFLEQIPVRVILEERAAMIGAARCALGRR
jgi:glucokinase